MNLEKEKNLNDPFSKIAKCEHGLFFFYNHSIHTCPIKKKVENKIRQV